MPTYKTWIEVEVEIDYDFQHEEKPVLYPNDEAYPGCPASVSLNSADIGGTDILGELDGGQQQTLEDDILEHELKGDDQ